MRNYNYLTDAEMERLLPIFKGIITVLESEEYDSIEVSMINVGPKDVMDILDVLGYEREDEWNANGWEQDTWYYFDKPAAKSLCLFYCGFTGKILLSLKDE